MSVSSTILSWHFSHVFAMNLWKKRSHCPSQWFFWSFYERFLILNLPDITILAHGFFLIGDEEFDSLDRLGTLGASKAIRMVKLIQCPQFGLKDGLVATCAFFPRGLKKKWCKNEIHPKQCSYISSNSCRCFFFFLLLFTCSRSNWLPKSDYL